MTAMAMAFNRRRAFEDPPSRLAIWSRRLAVFALAVALLAIFIEQADLLEIVPVLVTFAAALVVAALAVLVAFAAFVALWQNGGAGLGQAVTAVLIGVGLLAYPGYLGYQAYTLPAINDITTDPIDPPRFEVVARLRPPNTTTYPGLATAELQKETWPDIEPLIVSVNAKTAYDSAMAIMTRRKWRVVDSRAPQPGRDGHIEAIARTPIMGLRDDIVVRIRTTREGTRVDLRSASRYGLTDFGANANRVLALLDDIDDAAVERSDQPERTARQARPTKPAPKVAQKPAQSAKR
jgi:uncharacterized protein (DUF1499 family)